MTDITSGSTFTEINPAQNGKILNITTAATADASDTISVAGYIKTIRGVLFMNNAGNAAVGSGTWSGTTITIPSAAGPNKTFNCLVWGTD